LEEHRRKLRRKEFDLMIKVQNIQSTNIQKRTPLILKGINTSDGKFGQARKMRVKNLDYRDYLLD